MLSGFVSPPSGRVCEDFRLAQERAQTVVTALLGRDAAIRQSWKRLRQGDNLASYSETLPESARRSMDALGDLRVFHDEASYSQVRLGSKHGNHWT